MELLNEIQQKIKAPKTQWNQHGKFKYRSCADILGAVKPLLGMALLTMDDDMVQIGDRYYIKATVTLSHEGKAVTARGYAREADQQKGMGAGQLSCSTSSYARKIALNGLFMIDDSLDAGGDGNGKEPTTLAEILKDAHYAYGMDQGTDIPEGFVCDFEKFKDALRAAVKAKLKTQEERKAFAWTLKNLKPYLAEINLADTLTEIERNTDA